MRPYISSSERLVIIQKKAVPLQRISNTEVRCYFLLYNSRIRVGIMSTGLPTVFLGLNAQKGKRDAP